MVKINELLRSLPAGQQTKLLQRKVGKNGDVFDVIAARNKKANYWLSFIVHELLSNVVYGKN